MTLLRSLLSLCLLLVAQDRALPRFKDYPVNEPLIRHPAPVDFSRSPDERRFRTVLVRGARKGPNFAGHYTVVIWGCGSPCKSFAIVDARTGQVHSPGFSLTLGACYRLDSDLFIVDPPELWRESYGDLASEAIGGYGQANYYRWNGQTLVAIDSFPVGNRVKR
jgi:hypothetical protein